MDILSISYTWVPTEVKEKKPCFMCICWILYYGLRENWAHKSNSLINVLCVYRVVAMDTDARTEYLRGKNENHQSLIDNSKKPTETYEPFLSSRLRAIQAFDAHGGRSKLTLDILTIRTASAARNQSTRDIRSAGHFQNKGSLWICISVH